VALGHALEARSVARQDLRLCCRHRADAQAHGIGKHAIEGAHPRAGDVARLRVSHAYALLRSPKLVEIVIEHATMLPR